MLEIITDQEINFEKIFGTNKINGYTNAKGKHIKGWKELYSIYDNKDIQSWIRNMIDQYTEEGKDPAKFSFTSYIGYLQQYCDFNKTDNPSELLTEDIDGRNARLKKYLTFLYNAEEEEIKKLGFRKRPSDVSIRNMIQSRIKGFFSDRGVNISYGMKARKSGANKEEIYLDKDMIKQIQNLLESRQYNLINKFETQTGLRISDVLDELTNGKYKIEQYKKHYFIRDFISHKEKVIINFLFFTTELSELLASIYPKDKMEEIDLTKLFLSRKNKRIRGIDYLARVKAISKKLGFNGNLKTHAFRKYFTNTIANMEESDDRFNQHLEGREPNYRDSAYITSLKNFEWYYTKWLRVEKEICVDCIILNKTNEVIIKLKTEIAKLTEQNEIAVKENANLSLRLDKFEEQMKKILKKL